MSVLQPIEKAVMVHVRKGLNLLHDNARQFPLLCLSALQNTYTEKKQPFHLYHSDI